jgi:hypothetical protein
MRRRARESARRATDFTSCAAIRYAKGVLGLGDEDASTPAARLSFIGGRAAVAFDTIWVAPKTTHPKSSCKIKRCRQYLLNFLFYRNIHVSAALKGREKLGKD